MNSPTCNHLLNALPQEDYERIEPHLESVTLKLGEVLYESGDQMRHAYFPTTAILSLLYVLEDGASVEIAVVGNEGMLGIALFMGGHTTPSRAIVRCKGQALRLKADNLLEEFQLVDMARKVVGVGSVGTRAWIILMLGRDESDPLFLQVFIQVAEGTEGVKVNAVIAVGLMPYIGFAAAALATTLAGWMMAAQLWFGTRRMGDAARFDARFRSRLPRILLVTALLLAAEGRAAGAGWQAGVAAGGEAGRAAIDEAASAAGRGCGPIARCRCRRRGQGGAVGGRPRRPRGRPRRPARLRQVQRRI